MKPTSIGRIALAGILALVFALGLSAGEIDDDPSLLDAPRLSEGETASAGGRLPIFGVRISLRLKRNGRRQTNRYPGSVQCDTLARNRADAMGLDTGNQDGSSTDYNGALVSGIYGGFPSDRSNTPRPATSGCCFTAYGSDEQHMGAYRRIGSSGIDTRHSNNNHVVSTNTRNAGFVPTGPTALSFVPLPRTSSTDLWYR